MSLTQLQLNNLSVAKDVGKAFGILSGIASDRFPTSFLLIIGAFLSFIGYGVQWLVVSHRISPLPYWLMCVFLCMGGNSSTWMNTAVLVTCIRNFPHHRGPVSGILKGYVGLSTAIFTDICTALFSSDPSTFLLMLTLVPTLISLIAVFALHQSPPSSTSSQHSQETHFFHIFNILAVIVASYLLAFDITGRHGRLLSLLFSFGLVLLLAMPLLVPLYLALFRSRHDGGDDVENREPLIEEKDYSGGRVKEEVKKRQPLIGEEHRVDEMVKTVEFWVLFVSFLCGVGTGLCVMNNMGQIGLAIGKSGMSRPLWNAASQILMAVGYIAMAMSFPGSLYIGSMLVGICYGVRLTITVAVASELFGLKYYGLLYNILILNLPLGSFIFSGLIAGYLYDAQATKEAGGASTCFGPHCYMLVFVIMAFVCVLGCGLDLVLAIRTRKVYSKIHQQKILEHSSLTSTSS
ncbi:protein NUCLEAR FUSION DEFECTIVE 4-like [Senna tora]|uniref:Protein NUCLEAR FUSION DEFECTIVE 4-like n=1 Tax=Senna tora TaxID=362788 RepID=A0A834W5Y8_9FABA|nr:protein NUCLEAR FUSION DEFECTIVE 4-like [Senna tora]